MAGGLELDDLQGPFQPLPFYDSVILCVYNDFLGYYPPSHLLSQHFYTGNFSCTIT